MTSRDENGHPIFKKDFFIEWKIQTKVVYSRLNGHRWEVFFDGKMPEIMRAKGKITDQAVPLWDLSSDPSGARAYALHKKLISMANEGSSLKELITYCQSL